MSSYNPDNQTLVTLRKDFGRIEQIFQSEYDLPFVPLEIREQLVSTTGDILNVLTTVVKPLSRTWVDKTSGEIRAVSPEEIENQYDTVLTSDPDHLSIVVTAIHNRNGMLNLVSYCSQAAEHELLVGSLVEKKQIAPELAIRLLNYETGGILVPTIIGKTHLVITGVISGNKPLKDLPNDSLFHLSAWGMFPDNSRVKSKILSTVDSIGEGLQPIVVRAYNDVSKNRIENPLKLLTVYDTTTKQYLT